MNPYNILIDLLPESVTVCDEEFPINSDFRTGILFEQLMQDRSIDEHQKLEHALRLWFPEDIPNDINGAVDRIIWFYSCGRKGDSKKRSGGPQKATSIDKRIYDFDVDAPLIYAAFLSQYNVDLQDVEHLHWWKFQAMFISLPSTCEIVRIMNFRGTDVRKFKNKAERAYYAEMQSKYALPSLLTTEQKQALAGSIFAGQMRG